MPRFGRRVTVRSVGVSVGQIWIDKDKRMSRRRVKVIAVEGLRVRYSPCNEDGSWVSSLSYTSKLGRFPLAYELAEPPQQGAC